MPLVEASHLSRSFGDVVAVDDVSLRVSAGEIYGLVGPDGAGKTTTLRLLCGAYLPTVRPQQPAASIRVVGFDVLKQTERARAQIGYLPQRFSLYEDLTVIENIRFFAEVRGLPSAEWRPRCMEILAFVGLDSFLNRPAGYLSGGMKQKLGLAAALVHRPRLLLLDEPTTGVDPVTRQDFWQLIIRLVAGDHGGGGSKAAGAGGFTRQDEGAVEPGTAVLVSTPYMDEAARCTRLGFMSHGRLVLEGSPAELRSQLGERILELRGQPLPLLRRLVAAAQASPAADPGEDVESRGANVEDVQMFGDRLHLRVKPGQAQATMAWLQEYIPGQGGHITSLRSIHPQLEDVFMHLLQPENGQDSAVVHDTPREEI
ncbi:MAG: ABC transporter ATP-binding protein [Chloroflexota bacterium]